MADNINQVLGHDEDSPSSSENTSSFRDIYKYSNRDMSFSLEKKRQEFLQMQREKRNEAYDEKRELSQLFDDGKVEKMECTTSHKTKKYKKNLFGYKLMTSGWFTEVPDDLTENWLVKFCPEGVRSLVVANKAITTCYYKNGKPCAKFKSNLPGGNSGTAHRFTVLDCIYNKNLNTLFIYDVLAWNSTSLLYAEAEMRFFWLNSKFKENPEMLEINPTKFFLLMDFLPCDKTLIQDKLFTPFLVNGCEMSFDCILFYHKEGHYTVGRSPLVGWLKTFMVPEVLNVDVHPSHLRHKPEDYENIQQYIDSTKKKKVPNWEEMEYCEEVEAIECEEV